MSGRARSAWRTSSAPRRLPKLSAAELFSPTICAIMPRSRLIPRSIPARRNATVPVLASSSTVALAVVMMRISFCRISIRRKLKGNCVRWLLPDDGPGVAQQLGTDLDTGAARRLDVDLEGESLIGLEHEDDDPPLLQELVRFADREHRAFPERVEEVHGAARFGGSDHQD